MFIASIIAIIVMIILLKSWIALLYIIEGYI